MEAEYRLPMEERRRRRQEYQDVLLAEKMRRQEEQTQRVLESAKEKILQQSAPYRDLQSIVLVSKVTKDNQALCQLQREKKAREKADRTTVSEYKGGQLPINEEVQKYEQQIEERKERERQAAHSYNAMIRGKKAQEKRCTPGVPPSQVHIDECADKRSTKIMTYKMYLESVDLKRIQQQREQQQSAETEKQWRREQAEVDARQEGYLKQAQERFKQQQVHREEATLRLDQLKKEQEARARQDEEERKLQVWLFERNLDDKPQKETAKQMTEFWSTQVEQKRQEKRAEQLRQINLLRKEREKREQDELESQRKQAQRRQKAQNLVHFNSSLVSQKVILKARHEKQELEEKERQAQKNMDKKQQHLDYVEQAIQTAAAEDRIILPLLAQRQRFEEDDCLHYCLNHNVYAMKHKRMCGTRKNMGHLGSRVHEQEKIELTHEAARPVKEAQTPPEKAPEEIPACIPVRRQNAPPTPKCVEQVKRERTKQPSPYGTSVSAAPSVHKVNPAPKKLLALRTSGKSALPTKLIVTNKVVLKEKSKQDQRCPPERVKLPPILGPVKVSAVRGLQPDSLRVMRNRPSLPPLRQRLPAAPKESRSKHLIRPFIPDPSNDPAVAIEVTKLISTPHHLINSRVLKKSKTQGSSY